MFFKWFKRSCHNLNEQYRDEVQKYLDQKSFMLVQRIKGGILNTVDIEPMQVCNLLGEIYPKAPWVDRYDAIEQFISLFEEIGYNFSKNDDGKICFDSTGLCDVIIKNYLKNNGKKIMDRIAECCSKTNGKMTYRQMRDAYGFDYSKIDFSYERNMDFCILLFLKETKLPFKHNDTHIYLP